MAIWETLLWGGIAVPSPDERMDGLLLSFANRWRDTPAACTIVPFDRFFTGRVPTPQEYPFPYMSVLLGSSRQVYRSDKSEGSRRIVTVHIWVDPTKLEEDGEAAAEMVRRIYANQAWCYNYGRVIDVLDGGPPNVRQVNEPTMQAWEVVRVLSLCIEQTRMNTACTVPELLCGSGSCDSSSSYSSTS